eukprot:g22616.t1
MEANGVILYIELDLIRDSDAGWQITSAPKAPTPACEGPDPSYTLGEDRPEESVKVEDALRFLKLFDPQKTGFLPRQTIATIVQLCSSRLSEEKLEETFPLRAFCTTSWHIQLKATS